ncbi:uncharacterized protein MONOS_214 [Monocercomonoides exilis]|uniref:uncharacterized protein n=1 Tax=Monocercomonoides exilis TaxID=2049356 RepID=UPI00355A9D2B|nr:hypothetical protein MONOS_214 [Monocercomonoides exilis]
MKEFFSESSFPFQVKEFTEAQKIMLSKSSSLHEFHSDFDFLSRPLYKHNTTENVVDGFYSNQPDYSQTNSYKTPSITCTISKQNPSTLNLQRNNSYGKKDIFIPLVNKKVNSTLQLEAKGENEQEKQNKTEHINIKDVDETTFTIMQEFSIAYQTNRRQAAQQEHQTQIESEKKSELLSETMEMVQDTQHLPDISIEPEKENIQVVKAPQNKFKLKHAYLFPPAIEELTGLSGATSQVTSNLEEHLSDKRPQSPYLDPLLENNITHWRPQPTRKSEYCFDMECGLEGEKASNVKELQKRMMIKRWKKEDATIGESTEGRSKLTRNNYQKSQDSVSENAIDGINKGIFENEKTDIDEVFHEDTLNEKTDDLKQKTKVLPKGASELLSDDKKQLLKRRHLIKKQIKEAKQFMKLYDEWVCKDWIEDEYEMKLWEEAESKYRKKEKQEEDEVKEGKVQEPTLEELKTMLKEEGKELPSWKHSEFANKIQKMEIKLKQSTEYAEMSDLERFKLHRDSKGLKNFNSQMTAKVFNEGYSNNLTNRHDSSKNKTGKLKNSQFNFEASEIEAFDGSCRNAMPLISRDAHSLEALPEHSTSEFGPSISRLHLSVESILSPHFVNGHHSSFLTQRIPNLSSIQPSSEMKNQTSQKGFSERILIQRKHPSPFSSSKSISSSLTRPDRQQNFVHDPSFAFQSTAFEEKQIPFSLIDNSMFPFDLDKIVKETILDSEELLPRFYDRQTQIRKLKRLKRKGIYLTEPLHSTAAELVNEIKEYPPVVCCFSQIEKECGLIFDREINELKRDYKKREFRINSALNRNQMFLL